MNRTCLPQKNNLLPKPIKMTPKAFSEYSGYIKSSYTRLSQQRITRIIFGLLLQMIFTTTMYAQFGLDAELRPRAELRSGFRQLRDSTSKPAGLVSQRSRINLNYKNEKFATRISVQDVRVWGDEKLKQDISSMALHEAWINLNVVDSLSLKLGRQELIYDNQRLLGNVNWLQQASAHDAAVVKFHYNNWTIDLGLAFNQTSDTTLSDTYYSMTKNNYKNLDYIWLTKRLGKLSISGAFIADGYQKAKDTLNMRLTYCTVIAYASSDFSVAGRGFLQGGKTITGQAIQAYYLSAEASYTLGKFKPVVGLEYFSGNDNSKGNAKFHAFNNLYGTAHIFNGFMEYFTTPASTKNAGLIDLYVNCSYKINDIFFLRGDYHYFALQNKYIAPAATESTDKYLGSELDLSLKATLSKEMVLDLGYSFLKASKSLAIVQGHGDSGKLDQWAYVMLTIKPKFL